MHYFYGHYYAVQAMWTAGGRYWSAWYPAVRDELVGRQAGTQRVCAERSRRNREKRIQCADAEEELHVFPGRVQNFTAAPGIWAPSGMLRE